MKKLRLSYLIYSALFSLIANSYLLIDKNIKWLFAVIPCFLIVNVLAGTLSVKTKSLRLKICCHGAVLLSVFCVSVTVSIIYHIILAFRILGNNILSFALSALFCIILETLLFWNGIICVYLTSVQLGIKQRIIGIICGMIPIVNIIVLFSIIKTVKKEVSFEAKKEELNFKRSYKKICKTKYPLLLVHGVFFRDYKYFNYWGRIPDELIKNGATVYYGNHQSAAAVKDSAAELAERIKEIVSESGCEKINIIAHSKGGLDCRYAISELGVERYIASLTTVNTPHKGCQFADFLLSKISPDIKNRVAETYNKTLKKLGDENPDFLAAVSDLTAEACKKLNLKLVTPKDIYCQSIGSVIKKASNGKFPLNFSYHLVKYFDGDNDGLVSESSFKWGEKYTLLSTKEKRGISHGDVIDLNRENFEGFDVREFYVNLVNDLKNKGF